MNSIRDAIKKALGKDAYDKVDTPKVQMAVSMNRLNKPYYQGSVPAAKKAQRRATNKRARIARRAHR